MKARLLIVDDEPDARRLLAYRFTREGFKVLTTSSAREAIQKARSFGADLIILDLVLPDVDGFSLCDALRAQAGAANTPVVFLSAHGGLSVKARAAESGVLHCFTKGADLKALIHVVREILHARLHLQAT